MTTMLKILPHFKRAALTSMFAATAFAVAVSYSAHAQSDAIRSAHQEVIQSADALNTSSAQTLTAEEHAQKELELKRNALEKIIELSIVETQSLKTKLSSLDGIEAEYVILQNSFTTELEEYLDYFAAIGARTQEAFTKEAIQTLAGEFKEWRETHYDPEVKKVVEFTIVFQTRAILKTADQRFSKIAADLKKVRFVRVKADASQNLLVTAAANLKAARETHGQALRLLSSYLPPPPAATSPAEPAQTTPQIQITETTVAPPISLQTPETVAPAQELPPPPAIRTLIEKSLLHAKDAYRNFIELSAFLKRIQ